MCAIFGLIDYRNYFTKHQREKVLKVLSKECEVRGTDATGFAYIHDGKLSVFKRPLAAHKVKLRLPFESNVVMGHTRMATQGNKFENYNNHPFSGRCGMTDFALAHNGVLHNVENTVTINKSYQRLGGRDVITDPKTPKSNRVIKMPDFLSEEIENYIDHIYGIQPDDRIFQITKGYLHNEMTRGANAAGVKRIRIHDLRHSHVSLLIDMGYSAVAIGERVGHESADITYHYAHLFPSVQTDMANDLNNIKLGGDADVSEKP